MKKMAIIGMLLVILVGCSMDRSIETIITSFDFDHGEIRRVDKQSIYVNQINTMNNTFLFTTDELLLLNLEGGVEREIKTNINKRVVDFMIENKEVYYFYIVAKEEQYILELCHLDNKNHETIIQTFILVDNPILPRFQFINNEYHFNINHTVYKIVEGKVSEVFSLDRNEELFLADHYLPHQKLYYKLKDENGYQLYYFENGQSNVTPLKTDFGNFIVLDNKVYYINNKDRLLYQYDLDKKKEQIIYNEEIVKDFKITKDNLLALNSNNNLVFLDLDNQHKEIKRIELNEDQTFTENYKNVYTDDSYVFVVGDKKIKRIEMIVK